LLKQRWPHAKIIGLDSSPNMLQEAKNAYPELSFIEGDIASFTPAQRVDCLFANASLQWLDQHEILIPRLFELLNPGGILAIQMPNNFHSPMHQVSIRILHSRENWRHLLSHLRYGFLSEPVYQIPWYYELLTQSGCSSLLLWETQYFQEMVSYHSIFEWVKGTNLRLVMSNMDDDNQDQFAKLYIDAISKEYPLQSNKKILLPFTRIFLVGFKSES
jgi:trans-aconitate 2-methyltransferase